MEKSYYRKYYDLEREHWWFKARLKILGFIIRKKIFNNTALRILNAGAATGATSIMLKEYGEVLSLEHNKPCAEYLSEILNEKICTASITDIPISSGVYDLVCAFDVIEHIKDHETAVMELNRVLKDKGYVFLTVPSFNFLWSEHDEINHHYRRYTLSELKNLLYKNGFSVEYASYFNFILFPPILLVRLISRLLLKNKKKKNIGSDFEIFNANKMYNNILYAIFKSEIFFLNLGIHLPFGVSCMVIGKKIL